MKRIFIVIGILLSLSSLHAEDSIVIDADGSVKITVNGNLFTIESLLPPIGSIEAYGGTEAPEGWLICDGRSLNSSEYPDLYAIIGTNFGDGSTDGDGGEAEGDFNLPDLRSRFLRGVDSETDRDPDLEKRKDIQGDSQNDVGGIQDDAFQGHWHLLQYGQNEVHARNETDVWENPGTHTATNAVKEPISDGKHGDPRVSSETRPVNVAVNFIIKY